MFAPEDGPHSWLTFARRLRHRLGRVLVVLHLFAGEQRGGDLEECLQDLVGDTMTMMFFSVDLCRHSSWGLSSSVVFDVIVTAIQEGLIDAVMSGPPCATWSRAR